MVRIQYSLSPIIVSCPLTYMDWFHPLLEEYPVTLDFFNKVPSDKDLMCRSCDRRIAKTVTKVATLVDPNKPWFVQFECSVCKGIFYWCRVCSPKNCFVKRQHWTKPHQLNNHERVSCHRRNMAKLQPVPEPAAPEDRHMVLTEHDLPMEEENWYALECVSVHIYMYQ